jgi:hypothetical protein
MAAAATTASQTTFNNIMASQDKSINQEDREQSKHLSNMSINSGTGFIGTKKNVI